MILDSRLNFQELISNVAGTRGGTVQYWASLANRDHRSIMNTHRKFNVLGLATLALLISACGGSDQSAPQETVTPPTSTTQPQMTAAPPAPADEPTVMSFNMAPLLDPNTATAAQLAAIDGLSEAGVQAVIDGRPFATPSELHAAIGNGLSEQDQFSVYSAMFIKVNLNSGATEDFQLVPSTMSARKLAHEFEEYRPYTSMTDFSREMKKYVSDEEVAFLERFVTID